MNKYQKIVLAVGAATLCLTTIMPPEYMDYRTMTTCVNWGRLVTRFVTITIATLLSYAILGKAVK